MFWWGLKERIKDLLADAKAVSFHNFSVLKTADGWRADVIVDV